mmetsp:Transcript_28040/g.27727  ORF Transcript_28040/g.27727 Transcript_28040/m.27727 type:complete len:143 (+) Transcript_28040:754-1182(+)
MNKYESIEYHKCKRPNDTEDVISYTYDYLRGSFLQYDSFLRVSAGFDKLEKCDAEYIIKELIRDQKRDFERADIFFDRLDQEISIHKDGEAKKYLFKTFQLMYLLIKNEGPILEENARYFTKGNEKSIGFIFKTTHDFKKNS